MNNHKISCFWAEQETHYDLEKTVAVKTEADDIKIAVITAQNKIITDTKLNDEVNLQLEASVSETPASQNFVQTGAKTMQRQSHRRYNAHYEHKANAMTDAAITFINNNDFGWTADHCKL